MITRPLDLSSRLRPEPRNFDAWFFVNACLIVLFFSAFGSRFILAPGLGIDFRLPVAAGATLNARAPTHVISVTNAGQILTPDGSRKIEELPEWLQTQARGVTAPRLLVRASSDVPISLMADISSAARSAGFDLLAAAGDSSAGEGHGSRKGR